MAQNIDDIARRLQETVLAGYSERFKHELFNPENMGKVRNPDSHVRITGVCGDAIEMSLTLRDERVSDVKFTTDGCGATVACASCVTRMAKGKPIKDVLRIEPEDVDDYFEGLPDESKHCAKLAVMALRAVLEQYGSKPH
jgi:nitrogen fixation NifU-like protein